MSLKGYCHFTSFCINNRCKNNHYYNDEERKLLFTIINKTPEIADYKERQISKPVCKHGLRCIDVDCDLYHGLDPDGRKILIKKFNKEWKTIQTKNKIRAEIEEYKKGVSYDWNDLDPRP